MAEKQTKKFIGKISGKKVYVTKRQPKHYYPSCTRRHIDTVSEVAFNGFTYLKHNNAIYINAHSIYLAIQKIGMSKQAENFMVAVSNLLLKKDE